MDMLRLSWLVDRQNVVADQRLQKSAFYRRWRVKGDYMRGILLRRDKKTGAAYAAPRP
jgi:hypothetical protein